MYKNVQKKGYTCILGTYDLPLARMSRRFYIPMVPVSHINGKIAPQWYKAKNTTDPEHTEIEGYFYGYRHIYNPSKSCFGIRKVRRNLLEHPYTTSEQENRDLFTASLIEVNTHLQVDGDRQLCEDSFAKQKSYNTLRGYAVAMVRANGGEWLAEWIK